MSTALTGDGSLLGREALLADLDRVLTPGSRLCLWGPAGVGKTAVAAAYTGMIGEAGALSVTVAPTDPDLLSAVGRALGCAAGRQETIRAVLAQAGPMLVWVDALEEAGPAWQPPPLPEVTWLVCARTRLAGWPDLRVPPLSAEAGAALWRRLCLSGDDIPEAVAELVTLLDGLPLALQLAARRRRLLSMAALLERLRRSVDVLGRGHRLDAAVQDAVASLPAPAADALRRLSVARSDVPLEAAEVLLADLGDPLDLLQDLTEASLIEQRDGAVHVFRWARSAAPPEAAAQWRAWQLATAEAWAAARPSAPTAGMLAAITELAMAPDLAPLTRLQLVPGLRGRVPPRILRDLIAPLHEDDLPPERQDDLFRERVLTLEWAGDVQQAHRILARHPERVRAAKLHAAWAFALDCQGKTDAAIAWIDTSLSEDLSPHLRGDLLWFSAWLRWWCRDDTPAARQALATIPTLFPDNPDRTLRGRFLDAAVLVSQGQISLACSMHERLQTEATQAGMVILPIEGRLLVMAQLIYAGELDRAEPLARRALADALKSGSPSPIATAHNGLASIAAQRGRVAAALQHIGQGLDRCRPVGLARSEAYLLLELAVLQALRLRTDEAAQALADARSRLLPHNRYGEAGLAEVVDGFIAFSRARQTDSAADWAAARAALSAGEGAPRPPRDALRVRLAAALSDHAPRTTEQTRLLIGPDAGWFQVDDSPPVDLRRTRNNRRLLAVLVERSLSGLPGLTIPELVAAVWPGQRILERAARHRVHVAVSALRRAGLAELLLHTTAGYTLAVPGGIRLSEESDPVGLTA